MNKKPPKNLTIVRDPGKSDEQALAKAALDSAVNAANVVDTYQGNIIGSDLELDALVGSLKASMDKSAAGDLSELEALLIGQAMALQTMFVSLAKRAHAQQYQRNLEAFMGLALKAQAQSRATIQALVDLKYPRRATFVKQANIAHGPQQVNNGIGSPAPALENKSQQNELLAGGLHGSKKLDTRAAATPAGGNTRVEALEPVNRPQKR
jgi:hypothetical protein